VRSREHTRGCCAPGHSRERSRNSTRNSPRRLTPSSITYSLAPEYSHNETRGPPDHIVSNPRARASASVAAVRPITRTGVVATQPTRSLGLSQESTRDPPDHIVSNPRARACASVAAVRPITRTGAVATRPTRSLSQIQDCTRAPPGVLARVRLSLTRRSASVAAARPITHDSTSNPPGRVASDLASRAGVSRGCSVPDRSPKHK